MKLFNLLVFCYLLINSCSKEQETTLPDQAIIAGKISNFEEVFDHGFVTVLYYDMVEGRKVINQDIDDSGKFKIVIKNLYRPKEIGFKYGPLLSYYIKPGDSLHFQVDYKCLKNQSFNLSKLYSYYQISGDSKKINSEIIAYKLLYYDSSYNRDQNYKLRVAIRCFSPSEYKEYTEDYFKKKKQIAHNYIASHNPGKEFKKWVEYDLKFREWNELMRYRWYYPHENQIDVEEFVKNMPDSYFAFLNSWDKDNKNYLQVNAYHDFLGEYTAYKNNLIDPVNFRKSISEKKLTYQKDFDQITNLLYPGEEGFILDLLIGKRFYGLLQTNFEKVKDSVLIDQIKDPEIREILHRNYEYAKELSRNQSANQIKEELTENFIQALIKKHPDKILYIDFWAPWCGPCMGELPYSNKLKELLGQDEVAFVYLANRCGETSWKKAIQERSIKGEHYLLNDTQFSNMSKTFEISGIPHYVLIDKKGNIINNDAPRPSSGEVIIDLIKELIYLNQKQ